MANVAIDLPAITALRGALSAARLELVDRLFELEDASNAFKEVKRSLSPGSTGYTAADERQRQAVAGLSATRATETAAYQALQSGLVTWLFDQSTETDVTVADDIARLDHRFPIVMFPLRIETRFDATKLKVRVFPDEIFLNRHETALTVAEQEAGKKYYDDLNFHGEELKRWQEIIQRFGPERSAYICKTMRPTGFGVVAPDPDFPCSEKITGNERKQLTFPTVKSRAGAWTRPGEAVLPDRWVVVTYRNGVRKVQVGRAIVEPLAMTTDPGLPAEQQTPISSNDYKIDEKLRWTVDFDRAKQVGMGIEIDLDGNEAAVGTGGFDRVIVFGVKSSMDAPFTTLSLLSLFDAHHHTRGLAFVRQGTPTNNTADSPTPFPPDDDDGQRSFDIERKHPPVPIQIFNDCLPTSADGYFAGFQLGLPSGIFANVDRATEQEVTRGAAMKVALWPLTYGYFMKVLMAPVFSDSNIVDAKNYYTAFVNPRGFAPAFRIGAVPYGILPAVSIYRWQQPEADVFGGATSAAIIEPLRRLIPIWLDASAGVPRVTGSATDPDVELMSILSTFPSAKEVRVRHGVGHVTWYNIFNFLGLSFTQVEQRLNRLTEQVFRRIGHPEWRPRIGSLVFDARAWRLLVPLVVDKPSETSLLQPAPTSPNFITGIRTASVQQLKDDVVTGKPPGFSFLYSLLRHATLAEYGRIADDLAAAAQKWKEPELFGFPTQPAQPSIVQEELALLASQIGTLLDPHFRALDTLATATTAELERLLGETLDVSSHRLDAWVTGVATQRLLSMRTANRSGQYLGGYAWVENLRPVQRQFKAVDNVTFEIQPGTGGFIHTPSMTHAAAAAVLRSAHISMKAEDPVKFAVDLSSRRVRTARRALDEVRAGQPLGAVLGYRFERALHDQGILELDRIRFALRNLFPLVAGKDGVDTAELAENIAARNVVDGLSLIRARRTNAIDFAHDPNLPAPGSTLYATVTSEIDRLDELHDAIADLLTAESVYQLARGNVTGAAAPLDNLVVGGPPPDPAVGQSARTGLGIAHRVALVFPADRSTDLPPGWPAPTPRAFAEPTLDAWLGRVLGNPTNVTCTVTFAGPPGSATVNLSQLGLRPLDVLALARTLAEQGAGSVLDGRVLTAALGTASTTTNITIDYGPSPTRNPKMDRTFPEVLEVARALGAALGGARPLEIGDLLSPSELEEGVAEVEAPTATTDAQDIENRAQAAVDGLEELTNSTTVSADRSLARAVQVADPAHLTATEIQSLRGALTLAALFAPERAFPPRTASGADLLALATAVRTELQRRLDAVAKLPSSQPALAKDRVDLAETKLRTVFGSDFFALPVLHVPRENEVKASIDARSELLGTDQAAPSRYLQQAMRARPNLRRFQKFSIYAHALRSPPAALNVVQLPYVPGEQWLGLPLGSTEPTEGRAALLLLSEETIPDATQIWRGVMLEQWTEIIPAKSERTAIAYHYDTPRAAAPQAVLVAVPADADHPWQFEDLLATLNETLDLAKMRAVDSELLPLGQALPLSLLAQNDSPDVAIATLFSAFVGAPDPQAFQGFS